MEDTPVISVSKPCETVHDEIRVTKKVKTKNLNSEQTGTVASTTDSRRKRKRVIKMRQNTRNIMPNDDKLVTLEQQVADLVSPVVEINASSAKIQPTLNTN